MIRIGKGLNIFNDVNAKFKNLKPDDLKCVEHEGKNLLIIGGGSAEKAITALDDAKLLLNA